jgi:WD40 repeat protein
VAFSPDSKQAVSGGNDRVIRLWEVATGKEVRQFAGHTNPILSVAFTPDCRHLISGSSQYQTPDRVVRVWDAASGKELQGLDGTNLVRVESVGLSWDGRRALVSHGSGALRLWTRSDR